MRTTSLSYCLLASLLLPACDAPPPTLQSPPPTSTQARPDSLSRPLVDPAQEPIAAGEAGWGYRQTATADLDGDGTDERLVLRAQVESHDGQPLWEDGHTWHAYVEAPDGTRTSVYARFVPHGRVEALLTDPAATGRPALVLLERSPHLLGVYTLRYDGPGAVQLMAHYEEALDPTRAFIQGP